MQELIVEVERLVAEDPAASGDDELCADVLDAERLGDLVAVVQSRRLVELEVRKATDVRWGMSTGQWLAHRARLPVGVTRRRVRVARRLGSGFAEVDAAWADGRLNAEHVRVLHDAANVRIADEIAARLSELIGYASSMSFAHWRMLVRNLVCLLDQDGAFDPNDERERNRASFRDNPEGDGSLVVSFDRATYASIRHLVEARADRLFRAEQRERVSTPDLRVSSRATLLAMALVELVREGAASDPCSTSGPVTEATIVFTEDAEPSGDTVDDTDRAPVADRDPVGSDDETSAGPTTTVAPDAAREVPSRPGAARRDERPAHTGDGPHPDRCRTPSASQPDRSVWRAWTLDGLLLPADPALAAMICDAQVRGLVIDGEGRPLRMGRSVRYATAAQRAALGVRDGGCVFPGCDSPPSWCDAHHVVPVERFGTTDIEVLALLCRRHHRITHRTGWTMHATDDQWFWWRTPSGDTLWSQRHGRQRAGPPPPGPAASETTDARPIRRTGTCGRTHVTGPDRTIWLDADPPPRHRISWPNRNDPAAIGWRRHATDELTGLIRTEMEQSRRTES